MKQVEMVTNQIMILGHGIEYGDDERAHLSAGGQQRGDRFLKYYYDNWLAGKIDDHEAQVTCTGGSPLLAHGVELPENRNAREGKVMADYLMENGIPHNIIRVEDSSTSTLTNFTNSLKLDLIRICDFDEHRPLGIVTHPHHQKRVADLAKPLGFVSRESFMPISTIEQDDAKREFALRSLYRTILFGAKGPDKLVEREQNFFKLRGKLRGGKKPAEQ